MYKFKIFFSYLLVIFILCINVHSAEPAFTAKHVFELKGGEWARVNIKQKENNKIENFDFSWSIFDETNLIMQTFFRHYPNQFTLNLAQRRQHYVQKILTANKLPPTDEVLLMLVFDEFNNGKAKITVGILDPAGRIDSEFIQGQN